MVELLGLECQLVQYTDSVAKDVISTLIPTNGTKALWVEDIKREIMANGPVITASQIYLDLLTYKEGVYQYIDGEKKFRGL